ncbi:unnamed protein product [Dicrocoelium dendriticum]|nr:unnamed protein product [Dicrocoelium dendriticum]
MNICLELGRLVYFNAPLFFSTEIDLFPSTVSFDLRSSLRMKAAEPPAFRQPFSRCILCNAVLSPESVVLLACGSFNPITIMHLRMMELARDEVERSRTLPRSTNCTKGENACSGLVEDTSSIDVSSCTGKADFSCPNSVLPWNQSVLCGVLSPVSDTYAKSDLAPSSARIELARLACQFHSDWLAVDMWEATQPEWVPTRLVVDHLQLVLDRVWFKLIANESFTYTSVVLPNQPPVVPASNGQLSPQSRESAHVNAFDGLFSESWLLNCIKRTAQITGCSLCRKIPSTLHNARSTSSSASCEDADSISSTSHEVCCRWYPRPRVRLVFGADIIQSFQVPNLWTQEDLEHLLGQYGIICISRPGCDVSRLISDSELLRKYKGRTRFPASLLPDVLNRAIGSPPPIFLPLLN